MISFLSYVCPLGTMTGSSKSLLVSGHFRLLLRLPAEASSLGLDKIKLCQHNFENKRQKELCWNNRHSYPNL